MAKRWDDFVEHYVNQPFYWFQPKGFTIKRPNLPTIQKKLRLLRRFDGKPWRQAQPKYADLLRREDLFRPTRARKGSSDYAAIVRMNKEVFDSLGLVWVREDSVIQITEAGRAFLRTRVRELPDFVGSQLRRYMYPNPAVGRTYGEAGVFPYLALLAVLTHFPDGLPPECYELFISRIRNDDDIRWAVDHIRGYLRLPAERRAALVNRLESMPIVRGGRIVAHGRRTGLLRTIRLNRSYMLGFLCTPGLAAYDRASLRILPERFAEAQQLVQDHLRDDFYILFPTAEDWIAFYGEPSCWPTAAEALQYYRSRGDVQQALRLFREPRARRQLPTELRELPEGQFRRLQILERTLEDFLEFNLDLLEKGLSLVARQYSTPTGPLDLLARDRRKRWVVIELKRGRAADRTVGQLLRYMGFIVRERAGGKRSRVRGFAVAPDPDKRLIHAAEGAGVPIEVFEFTVQGKATRLHPARSR